MNEIRNHQHYEECKSLLQRSLEAEAYSCGRDERWGKANMIYALLKDEENLDYTVEDFILFLEDLLKYSDDEEKAEAKENFEAFADNCYCEFCNKYFA